MIPGTIDTKTQVDLAYDYLNENYWDFYSQVLNRGEIVFTTQIGSAALMGSAEDPGKLIMAFNPVTIMDWTIEETAGVIAHETMHALLDHWEFSSQFSNLAKFNVAADVVVNDYLHDVKMVLPDGALTGKNVIGKHSGGMTLIEVYRLLTDKQTQRHHTAEIESQYAFIDDKMWGSGAVKTAHVTSERPETSDVETEKYRMTPAWDQLIRRVFPTFGRGGQKRRPNWARQSRRYTTFHDTIMPSIKHVGMGDAGKGRRVLVALDVSSSVSAADQRDFLNVARSLKDVEATFITFSSCAQEFKLSDKTFKTGGGTNFDSVQEYAQSMTPQPTMIVMITDGQGWFMRGWDSEKYVWLLSFGSTINFNTRSKVSEENIFKLSDMVEKA